MPHPGGTTACKIWTLAHLDIITTSSCTWQDEGASRCAAMDSTQIIFKKKYELPRFRPALRGYYDGESEDRRDRYYDVGQGLWIWEVNSQ